MRRWASISAQRVAGAAHHNPVRTGLCRRIGEPPNQPARRAWADFMKPGALPRMACGFAADAAVLRARALRLEAAATRPWVLRLFAAVFTELLDALFTELLDAVFTELLDALFTELFDAVLTELSVDDLAATALPRDPPLLTCFDFEEAFAAATFGLLGVGDLAVLGLARIRGAAVSTLAGLSTAVISGLCSAASDSPLLVDLDSDSPRAARAPPPVAVTRTFAAFNARLNSAVEVDSVQTLAPSFQSMPALPQSALVSGCLEVSKPRGSPNAPMDSAARPDPALPSLGE
jgi:hypothetical protein